MCGRYTLFDEQDNVEIHNIISRINARYQDETIKTGEIYPTNKIPVLIGINHQTTPVISKWGFPGFGKSKSGVIINARAETAGEKKMFSKSLLENRCVIPSTGFYEWSKDKEKRKYLFNLPENSTLYMAGIYKETNDGLLNVILTTDANSSISDIHNRMPVILPKDKIHDWIYNTDLALKYIQDHMPILSRK